MASGEGPALSRELRPLAMVVVIGSSMTILDTTIVNVALQTLRDDFHASLTAIGWVTTAYMLALSAAIPLTGWMAERFGPRRVWMTAVASFVITSMLCGAAWSADSLIAFRVLQGLAGGMIMPLGTITIAQAAGPQRMGRVMSVIGVPMVMMPILGPAVGGALVELFSWRAVFYVNLPIGLAGLALAGRFLPRERAAGRAAEAGHVLPPFDRLGLLLLSPGVAAMIFAVSELGQRGTLADPVVWVPGVLGVAAVTAFCVRALHIQHPLVDVRLLRGGGFRMTAITVWLLMAALFGAVILMPLYFQQARGLSVLEAGLLLAPHGVGSMFGMRYGGRAADRLGGGVIVLVGLALLAVGTLPFVFLSAHTPYALLLPAIFIRGMGTGSAFVATISAGYATLERPSWVPRATPIIDVLQRMGGAFGIALMTLVLQTRLDDVTGIGPAANEARAHAFGAAYAWALAGIVATAVPALLLMREERRTRRRRAAEAAEAAAAAPVGDPETTAAALA